jgi:3-deoxy-manno-octulosonate cytidylyltransferase (CMP-KDO synthetase)
MKILGIIPARYNSSRFIGKPLIDIKGKSMIQRVYEESLKSNLTNIIVATDSPIIAEHLDNSSIVYEMTSYQHFTGTDRCCEVAERHLDEYDFVINIQGDMALFDYKMINTIIDNSNNDIVTLKKEINDILEINSESIVKVVTDINDISLYFSRLPIPHNSSKFYKHIGLYGFKIDTLIELCKLKPTKLEIAESLEQLRWMENGYKIKTIETDFDCVSIDTPDDLKKILKILQ